MQLVTSSSKLPHFRENSTAKSLSTLHGRALDVVPAYASLNILVPVAAAPMVFGEPAHPVSAAGLILLLAGVVVLARQQVAEASP